MSRSGWAALALVGWLVCFVVLRYSGTWTPFAIFGIALAVAAMSAGALGRALLEPSARVVSLGALVGATMVLATHWAYASAIAWIPPVAPATHRLFELLNVAGFSPAARALLISVIAGCEEVLFRGLVLGASPLHGAGPNPWSRRGALRIAGLTLAYALTTAPLGSPLLLACALICGSIWAVLRVVTGSLVAPILAHAIWDLGVLLVWPLV